MSTVVDFFSLDVCMLHAGVIEAGSVVGIMGGSGSGKTTFLDILSQKKKLHSYTGTVYINGVQRNPQPFKNLSIYAPQVGRDAQP